MISNLKHLSSTTGYCVLVSRDIYSFYNHLIFHITSVFSQTNKKTTSPLPTRLFLTYIPPPFQNLPNIQKHPPLKPIAPTRLAPEYKIPSAVALEPRISIAQRQPISQLLLAIVRKRMIMYSSVRLRIYLIIGSRGSH